MRVIVTGGRDWDDAEQIEDLFDGLLRKYPSESSWLMMHGCAVGADAICVRVAFDLGWEIRPYPAKWDINGKAAGPNRNQEMVDDGADMCFAFPTPQSKGTWDCIKRATRAGIPVEIFNPKKMRGEVWKKWREFNYDR